MTVRFQKKILPQIRKTIRTLLLDADDTLWENNIFFLECADQYFGFMETLRFERKKVEHTLAQTEKELVPTWGYGPTGFTEALGLTYQRLREQTGEKSDPEGLHQARSYGEPLWTTPMVLLEGVESTLRTLRPTNQLILVTKGEEAFQRDKIDRSGLGSLFDQIYIVPEKDVATYQQIVSEQRLDPQQTWMIGNSPKSDINPAVRAGIGAILIPHPHTWTAELIKIEDPQSVNVLSSFEDLIGFFQASRP